MLEDVHQQHEIRVADGTRSPEFYGLRKLDLRPLLHVPGIDANRACCRGLTKQRFGKEPRAGADVQNPSRAVVAERVPQRACLTRVVPVTLLIGAEQSDFLEIHRFLVGLLHGVTRLDRIPSRAGPA